MTRESFSADHQAAKYYIADFADIISSQNYSSQQVYNCDKTGLNFKALPEIKFSGNKVGFKMCKERLTVLAWSNAAENNKLASIIIRKSKKSAGF